ENSKVFAIVDPSNWIHECNEFNNYMSIPAIASNVRGDINISLDAYEYRADATISLSSSIQNLGKLDANFAAILQITDTANNLIKELGNYNLGTIEANGSVALNETYQNGTILSGEYIAKAVLKDTNGNIVDEATATFRISDDSTQSLSALSTTDKLTYNSSDTITIDTLISNESINSIANDINLTINIVDNSGAIVATHTLSIDELLPSTQRDYTYPYSYQNIVEGNYTIQTALSDSSGNIETTSRSIEVVDDLTFNIMGSIDVASRQLYVGSEQICSYALSNFSNQALTSLPIKVEMFDISSYTLYATHSQTIDINATESQSWSYSFDTNEYNVSEYSCMLSAKINGEWKILDNVLFNLLNNPPIANDDTITTYRDKAINFDLLVNDSDIEDVKPTIKSYTQPTNGTLIDENNGSFIYTPNSKFIGSDSFRYSVVDSHGAEANASVYITVEMPPILIEGELSYGTRGRLLILLDPCDKEPCVEPYNLKSYTPLDAQRAYLETLLTTHGYSYKIVTDANSFEEELRSGNYSTYLSFSESVKLSQELQQELRESIFKGDALLLAGVHDSRNSILHDAVGIKYSGHYSGTLLTQIQDANYTYFEELLLDKSSPMIYSSVDSTRIANYSNQEESNAVTKYNYGNATVLFVGYDLLIHATQETHYEQLLLELLKELKITKEAYTINELIPITLSLQNQGMATPVRVEMNLRGGSIIDALGGEFNQTTAIWENSLEEEQNQTYSFWVRSSSPMELSAKVISTLDGDAIEQINLTQAINLVAAQSLEEIVDSANAITLNDKQDRQKLKQIITSLEKAQKYSSSNDLDKALSNLLSATDTLDSIEQKEAIKALRVAIDHTIRSIEIQIHKGAN
ncbi:MAG: Ig-like domain-containing protein, partial [Campylobacterota bacterium]|nr:Ig-like domain-containing protein [Campylobacterota bacterium]